MNASNSPHNDTLSQGPILLYDGECGVCSASVQWVLDHERSHSLRFAALQSELGQQLQEQAGVPENIDSLLWVEEKQGQTVAHKWSSAVVATLKYVGGPWRLLAFIGWIPAPLRDWGYRLFARHRQKFAPTQCLLPSAETRARFLDA